MNEWQPITTAPMNQRILVAFHGHGVERVAIVTRIGQTGHWGDYDYINSHDGEPQYWMPLPTTPDGMAGPQCGCDGCTERFYPEYGEPPDTHSR